MRTNSLQSEWVCASLQHRWSLQGDQQSVRTQQSAARVLLMAWRTEQPVLDTLQSLRVESAMLNIGTNSNSAQAGDEVTGDLIFAELARAQLATAHSYSGCVHVSARI